VRAADPGAVSSDCSVTIHDPQVLLVVERVLVRLGAGRDVIELEFVRLLVAPVFVVLVKAADGAFLDRTLRSAVPVLARRLALVLRRGVRPEVAAARTGPGRGPGVRRTWRPPTWPRRAEAARCTAGRTRSRPAVPSRTRSASGAVFTGTCFADRERAPFEWLLIESADRRLGDGAIRVVDKREAAWAACFPVDREDYLGRFSDARQMLAQFRL
jgi:hypothetical protein